MGSRPQVRTLPLIIITDSELYVLHTQFLVACRTCSLVELHVLFFEFRIYPDSLSVSVVINNLIREKSTTTLRIVIVKPCGATATCVQYCTDETTKSGTVLYAVVCSGTT